MRLGVHGGTFDPIHFGHLLAAEESRQVLGLDCVLFVPAGEPPHKRGEPVSAARHREAMTRLAISDNPAFGLSSVDINRRGPHYTVDTVRLLRQEWDTGAEETFFIMGSDSLAQLGSWHQPARLIELCRLAVVTRPGYHPHLSELEDELPGISRRVDWVDMPLLEISSSDLQRRVNEGRSIRYQLPDVVARYVEEQGLYLGDWG